MIKVITFIHETKLKVLCHILQYKNQPNIEIIVPQSSYKGFMIQGPVRKALNTSSGNGFVTIFLPMIEGYYYFQLQGSGSVSINTPINENTDGFEALRIEDASGLGDRTLFRTTYIESKENVADKLNQIARECNTDRINNAEKIANNIFLASEFQKHKEFIRRMFDEAGIVLPENLSYEGMLKLLMTMRNHTDSGLNVPGRCSWNGEINSNFDFVVKDDD